MSRKMTTEPENNLPQIEWERLDLEKEDSEVYFYTAVGCDESGRKYSGTWVDIDFVALIENIKPL